MYVICNNRKTSLFDLPLYLYALLQYCTYSPSIMPSTFSIKNKHLCISNKNCMDIVHLKHIHVLVKTAHLIIDGRNERMESKELS